MEDNTGQPRMRLWIERSWFVFFIWFWTVSLVWGCELKGFYGCTGFFLSWVSLVWGCELKDRKPYITDMDCGSASYEAVNWKVPYAPPIYEVYRSASYEAVNWKTSLSEICSLCVPVSLVWGCELKGRWCGQSYCSYLVSLVWGCELKDCWFCRKHARSWVSLVGGCELKESVSCLCFRRGQGQPRMRLWIERLTITESILITIGQPRMRLWIERWQSSSGTYADIGQPRMRLWIERSSFLR